VNGAVKQRAIHQDKPIPEIPPILLNFAAPPEDLIEKVQDRIQNLIQVSDLKKGEQLIIRPKI
jgi:ATP-dependent DNA helicase 2 subunit 2